ncbi:MAG: hypothetical protein ACRD0Z_06930 [Acidimicrobiales bacterium]
MSIHRWDNGEDGTATGRPGLPDDWAGVDMDGCSANTEGAPGVDGVYSPSDAADSYTEYVTMSWGVGSKLASCRIPLEQWRRCAPPRLTPDRQKVVPEPGLGSA